jgi:hypothetical protein
VVWQVQHLHSQSLSPFFTVSLVIRESRGLARSALLTSMRMKIPCSGDQRFSSRWVWRFRVLEVSASQVDELKIPLFWRSALLTSMSMHIPCFGDQRFSRRWEWRLRVLEISASQVDEYEDSVFWRSALLKSLSMKIPCFGGQRFSRRWVWRFRVLEVSASHVDENEDSVFWRSALLTSMSMKIPCSGDQRFSSRWVWRFRVLEVSASQVDEYEDCVLWDILLCFFHLQGKTLPARGNNNPTVPRILTVSTIVGERLAPPHLLQVLYRRQESQWCTWIAGLVGSVVTLDSPVIDHRFFCCLARCLVTV